jgi:hypothetical protein
MTSLSAIANGRGHDRHHYDHIDGSRHGVQRDLLLLERWQREIAIEEISNSTSSVLPISRD